MNPVRRVLKWNVPVDDKPHPIGRGEVVHVACQFDASEVQVWTDEVDGDYPRQRFAQVHGTGHPVPADLQHVGSVVAADGHLVWHVFAEQSFNTGGAS